MACGIGRPLGIAALFLAALGGAQKPAAPPRPAFEVVSIRAMPPNAEPLLRDVDFTPVLPGGQYVDARTSLLFMIAFAYNVRNPSLQLVGLPDWAKQQSYAVAAKPAQGFPALPAAENREQVRLMLRGMLADRFHLRMHTETRQEPVLNLEVAKGGLKIEETDPPVSPAKERPVGAAVGNSGGRMIGNKSTMAGLAAALTIFLKRPVIDRTGLTGYYDFDVKWSAPEAAEGLPSSEGLGPEGIGQLISALQNRIGVQVRKTTGPVKYWVVDRVEPPTEN